MKTGIFAWQTCRYLVAFAALSLRLDCSALSAKALISTIARPSPQPYGMNLTVSAHDRYESSERDLAEGIKLIESMKSASSCKTKATQQLLNSCSALDDARSRETETLGDLDRLKSMYAARLAVCELQEAENPPPLPRCSSMGVSERLGSINHSQLASCLRELQNNMVFWGSYINNLQNVGYMCQVARAEIEKEELVEQRRASLQTTVLVTRVLSEFQQSVASQNAELLAHAQKLREMHRETVEELVNARKDTSATLHQLREEFGAQLQNVADKAEAVIKTVTTSASGTNEEVLQYVQRVQNSLENIWQMMAEGNAEIAARQLQDSTESHRMVLATQQALETIIMDEIGRLSDGLASISSELLLAGNQVTLMRHEHASLADSLDQSIAKSVFVADTLNKLNMPILEMFAKIASLANFILSDDVLVLVGFFSPLAVLMFFAMFVQFKVLFWLLRLGMLLISSYVILQAYTFWNSSSVLRIILYGAWQAITISLVIIAICGIAFISSTTARGTRRQSGGIKGLTSVANKSDEEVKYLQRARKKSLKNARKARFDRASTSPPC